MFTEGALRIELHRGSKVTVLDIQSDRALIGSGAHCDVRLMPDEAAVEQLMVQTVDEEVHARAQALDPPVLLNGAPFLEGRLPPDSMLELRSLVLCVKFAPRHANEVKKRRTSSTPPQVQALALLGLGVGFYFVLHQRGAEVSALAGAGTPPPALPASHEPCPQTDRVAAKSLAGEALASAETKRERSPFHASDGLQAVSLFERAASCYESAGDGAAADEAKASADELRRHLADELHVRHVRLERLLTEKNYGEALREAQLVAELVPDRSHPYWHWLSAVQREGELRSHAKGRKR